MESNLAMTVPQISTLKGHENLEEWKLQVLGVFKFYGMGDYISPPDALSWKRNFPESDLTPFLLGLLTASVSPVANRLVKAGWDFSKPDQSPVDLYNQTLKIVLPPSQLSKAATDTLRRLTPNPGSFWGLRGYHLQAKSCKRHLDALGCPIDDKLAVWLVLNTLETHLPDFAQQLSEDMSAGELTWSKLTWSKLMEKIAKEIARRDESTTKSLIVTIPCKANRPSQA